MVHELEGVGIACLLLVNIEAAACGCATEYEEAGNADDEGFVHDGLSGWWGIGNFSMPAVCRLIGESIIALALLRKWLI